MARRTFRFEPKDRARSELLALSELLCIDLDRVFAVGYGAGGYAVESLACTGLFKAVAITGYRYDRTHAAEYRKKRMFEGCDVPALWLSPIDVRRFPVEGTRGRTDCWPEALLSLGEQEQILRKRHGCNGSSSSTLSDSCRVWDCETPMQTCRVPGGQPWELHGDLCDGRPGDFPYGDVIFQYFESIQTANDNND